MSREHLIAPGVRGWLESPRSSVVAEDCLIASGWAFASGASIVGVWAEGLGDRRPLRHGLPRDDVARVYASEPHATRSGFSGFLEFDGRSGEPVDLEIWARLDDGRILRLFSQHLTLDPEARHAPVRFALRQLIRQPSLALWRRSWRLAFTLLQQRWWPRGGRKELLATFGARGALTRTRRVTLARFLLESQRIAFARTESPEVSIITVVWNRAELTLRCLAALAAHTDVAMEVIVVDNASTDETPQLLAQVDGIIVIKNDSNLGFPEGNNVGARAARGAFLVFLNNDAELAPGSLTSLMHTARRDRSIGAVGGKLIWPDGRLQEAGSIVWADGACEGYGRGGDPLAPEYNFERQVDFCSGALLLTPRTVFEKLGGFDNRYRPMYYEDADYCVRLWSSGYRVAYQPKAFAVHYEFGSASSPQESFERQRARRPMFIGLHHQWLSSQLPRDDGVLAARSHPHGQPSIILIDDAVPDPRIGSGFPRAAALLDALAEAGFLIAVYATAEDRTSRATDTFPGIEVIAGGPTGLRAFLTPRLASSRPRDLLIVSRPHNMQYVKAAMGAALSTLGVPCIYDAEAIYALREIGRRRIAGQPVAEADRQILIDAEIALTRGCAAVVTVNEAERQLFAAAGVPNVFVVGHAVEPRPTLTLWETRRSILFVGAFSPESPNEDAVTHFCRDVLPALRAIGPSQAPFVVAGARMPGHLTSLAGAGVSWHPDVDDLTPLYEDARVFVAPTRYAAGIPLKVVEAAARGVPIVCTPLLARQLGWHSGDEILTAESPADFARAIADLYSDPGLWLRLRGAALQRIARDYSAPAFRSALQQVIGSCAAHSGQHALPL